MTGTISFQQWEVWDADVPYLDDEGKSKVRPVVIISPQKVLVLKLTTHQHSSKPKPFEYELAKWEDAGLSNITFVQCDKFISLKPENFTGRKRGRLKMVDIIGIKNMLHFHGLTI
ncbi:MAG: type II toxin-antitoxin system PemK/MazF family toxin [Bacteroidales bacterium]|nr:type II toxin-antitoxin system PemK/MazF family toxin [Bacteroidales bacterium]